MFLVFELEVKSRYQISTGRNYVKCTFLIQLRQQQSFSQHIEKLADSVIFQQPRETPIVIQFDQKMALRVRQAYVGQYYRLIHSRMGVRQRHFVRPYVQSPLTKLLLEFKRLKRVMTYLMDWSDWTKRLN